MPDLLHARDIAHELKAIKGAARMTAGRKSIVVEAIRRGILTHARACEMFDLSLEELASWRERDNRFGESGLKVTKIQAVGR